jgi:3-deoxy-D-manno-octulosonic-acid transferase
VILLVELEIWPNFLRAAFREQIPVVLVNGRISEKSYKGYRLVKKLLFRPLDKIRRFCVQTEVYADRFLKLGVPASQILVTGTLKYDALPVADDAARLDAEYRGRLGLGAAPVIVAGSTHAPEERELLSVYNRLRARIAGLRLVLVPRHLERTEEVLSDVRSAGLTTLRKTEIDAHGLPREGETPVIVVDTIGELANVYAAATVVFVGGTLTDRGGQNMLEPAGLGRATVFGPRVENFKESAEMLLAAGGAAQVADAAALEGLLSDLLGDAPRREEMGRRARAAIDARRGAAAKTIGVLKDVIARDARLEKKLAAQASGPGLHLPGELIAPSGAS